MTLRDTQEAHGALLTAGALLSGLGFPIAAFPNGLWFGSGLAIIGSAVAIVATALAWKDWRRPVPPPDEAAPRDPDRFWNAEKRLDSLIGGSAAVGMVTLASSLLFPSDQRWVMVGACAVIFVLATTARLITRRRDR
jgi:hypothetical protein